MECRAATSRSFTLCALALPLQFSWYLLLKLCWFPLQRPSTKHVFMSDYVCEYPGVIVCAPSVITNTDGAFTLHHSVRLSLCVCCGSSFFSPLVHPQKSLKLHFWSHSGFLNQRAVFPASLSGPIPPRFGEIYSHGASDALTSASGLSAAPVISWDSQDLRLRHCSLLATPSYFLPPFSLAQQHSLSFCSCLPPVSSICLLFCLINASELRIYIF